MSNATNLSKLANLLDDGTTGQALVSDGTSNVAFETLNTSNVSEGTNLYFTDERVQTKLGSVSGNVVPDTNVAYDLGSAAYAFKDLYLSGSTINLGSLQLSDNGGSLEISPTGGGSAEPFATQAYVTTQVNNLVDAAPGTLDTLNELAAALGDDANFSTTVTNSIAAKANTSSLATVATSGSFSDLTGKPTTIAGYGITDAGGGGGNVVEYTSTNTAATNDIVMLNSDGTVTVVEPTNYAFDQQTAIDSQMTSGYLADLNYRGMIAHHSTREKGMLIFPGGTGHNDRTMLVVFSRNGSAISKGTAFSSGEPINNFRDQHAFFGPAGAHEDKFLYLGASTSGGNINVGTGNITGTTVNTTGTDSSAAYSNTTNNGQLNIGLNGRMAVDHGGFNGTVLTFYVKFENSNSKAAVRKFTYDFANQNLDYSFPEIETSSSETFEWEHTAIDPSTPTRIALYRQEGATSTRRGIIKFADVDWGTGTINIGPSADLFTRSGSHNVDAYEIQNKQAFHPTNGLLAAVTTSPADGGGDAPYRLKIALYSADANLNITNVSGNLTLMNGANVKVGTVIGNIAWTKGSNTGSTPNAPILITPIISNQIGSSPQTRYLQYDNSGNYITQTTDSNTFDAGSMWTYSSPFNDGDTASYSPDTVNSQYPQVIMTQGPYGESNFDATKLHGVAASAGTTIDVTLEHGIHTGLSGLTTGTKYFVTDSGGISTSGSAKLGTAINATSLALDFTDELTSADLGTYATKAYVGTEIAIKANTADLATVATSGSYNDLTNQPTIPSLSGYATETYVNTATANLVDSAPATLDTLNELAAALGDDANFSTTILAQLGAVSANTISNASNINAVQANLSASASTAAVTVSGGNFYIDGAQQTTISLEPGRTYKFDQSDSTNSSHPLRFSTTSDGTHGGGSEYTTGVTTSGTAGSANAYVQIAIDNSTPALYYYCTNHSGMGAAVSVGNPFNTDELSEGTSNLYYTDARVDARISGGVSANLNITSSPTKKYARLELTADQSISSTTQTILNFNTRSEDTSTANLLTTTLGSGKFIIPAGVTKVRLKGSAQGSSVADQFIIKIMKNGSNAVTTNFDISSTGSDFPAVFTGIESVVEGDYFQVSAYSQTSRTVNAGSLTWFELEVLEGSILDTTVSANVALADLNNVSNAAPADGQALIWNTSQSNWAPANVAAGGSTVSVSDTAPSSPSNGDQWFNSADGSMYVYYTDGSSNQWVSVSGPAGSSVSVGTTPPTGAANGDQWFNSDSATLYVYYADGSSSQWVAVSGPIGPQGPAAENAVTTGKAIAMSIVFG